MAAMALAYDWDLDPDIDINQSSPMKIDSLEPQIPDMEIGKEVPEKVNRLTAELQIEEDQILQSKREAKINNKTDKSLINYQVIQTILQTEIQVETDKDVQTTIHK